MKKSTIYIALSLAILMIGCQTSAPKQNDQKSSKKDEMNTSNPTVTADPNIYASVKLTTDLAQLSPSEKQMLPLLIEAAQEMDKVFQLQALPPNLEIDMATLSPNQKSYWKINYGPWDRLNGNMPFVENVGEKPLGAGFYPEDMTIEEFEAWDEPSKNSLYTVIRRNEEGKLVAIPFYEYYGEHHQKASSLLRQAAALAEDEGLKKYLNLRAEALTSDDYDASDIAWLDMETNGIDIIIGPIENYEDKLFGYKAANEAYVLVKDKEWSKRLEKYVTYLPELQKNLPAEEKFKQEEPGRDAQLNAYDVVFYAGDCNAGSKTIAVNLPNDEAIQKSIGTRRSQLKNAMQAKFDQILVPIANQLIAEDQRKHITFEAFFGNTMFHEVAHGLGIKQTIDGSQTVREALKEKFSALEEGKADILGLFMVSYLSEKGVYNEGELMDNYVTFMAGIFRSVRFGAASAHGKANMLRFNYFKERGAFSKDEKTGKYRVNFNEMKVAMNDLSALILKLQGEGDYAAVGKLMKEKGAIGADLQSDLDQLATAGIPVDIVFEQGVDALGL